MRAKSLPSLFTSLLLAMALTLSNGCSRSREIRLTGRTMGTTYHIKVLAEPSYRPDKLQERVAWRLEQINRSMSTFRPDSEISRFNKLTDTQKTLKVSEDFWRVLETARSVYALTRGAWDGTVYPLINLWGFTNGRPPAHLPSRSRIAVILPQVGFHHIRMLPGRRLQKDDPRVQLDLASIAKGYGVDCIAALIRAEGFSDFLVEIGGEVVASGRRRDGQPWQVGVSRPEPGDSPDDVYRVLALTNSSLATSGDYRNFFEIDGRLYSHVIDPRTGYPVNNGVVSVSVITPTCTLADGLATGIMVMGPQKGLDMINRFDNAECLIVVKNPDGRLVDFYSKNFKQFINAD